MLNSASDYKFVDTSQWSSKIHGNIIPKWQSTATNIPTYLENYLFILEAYNERMHPDSAGNNDVDADSIVLSGRTLYNLKFDGSSLSVSNGAIRGPQLGYDNDATYYVSPNTTYPNNHVNTGYTEDSTYYVYSFLQNWSNPCPESTSPYYGMQPFYTPSKLLVEYMKAKFWTISRMSKLLISLRLGDFATSIVHQTLEPDGTVHSSYEQGLRNTVMSYIRAYSRTTDGNGNTITYQLFKTAVAYKSAFFTFPYATNAVLIWKCSVAPMGGSSTIETKYVWGTKSISISNGALQVPTDMFETIADEACNISGRPTTETISWYNAYLLVDFEFPARLDGISWDWQPTYTS